MFTIAISEQVCISLVIISYQLAKRIRGFSCMTVDVRYKRVPSFSFWGFATTCKKNRLSDLIHLDTVHAIYIEYRFTVSFWHIYLLPLVLYFFSWFLWNGNCDIYLKKYIRRGNVLCTSLHCLFGSNGIVFTSKKCIYINCHQNIVCYFVFALVYLLLLLFLQITFLNFLQIEWSFKMLLL